MTRKTLITVIALIYMVLGFLNFYYALVPAFSSKGVWLLNLWQLVGGAWAFYAGLSMFRLSEFGRKFVVILLSIRVAINAFFLFRLPEEGVGFGIQNRLGEIIYSIESPFAYQGFLLVWLTMALLIIIFLSQKETKKIFMPATSDDVASKRPDVIPPTSG